MSHNFVVVGAGVIGLTTALSLKESYPSSKIQVIAAHLPGSFEIEYCSQWAGGNWCSAATDNGLLESFDRQTFERFKRISEEHPEAGIEPSPLRMIFDQDIENAEILSQDTGRIWYEELVGGIDKVPETELPQGAVFGLELRSTFVINTQAYLQWLLEECHQQGISVVQRKLNHISEAKISADIAAIFNCTGLSSYSLAGIEDKDMYPIRGQTILVEQPSPPLKKMYFRSPSRLDDNTTYIFQRPLNGGVVLGGCRQSGNWNGQSDPELEKLILRRCCELAPELGTPEDLKVIRHGVGLRPGRKGGPRIEAETHETGSLIIHNYGASGTGYQASWGMAQYAVKLFREAQNKF